MSDASSVSEGAQAAGDQVEFRPCPFCGAAIHPSSHRCPECCGHVGIAWGTVHKELYLFLLCSILIAVGCLASWTGRVPLKDAAGHLTGATGYIGREMTGLDTIRGTVMFAIAVYGVLAGMMNILYRRMVVWPYLLNALIALWVGVSGIASAIGGDAWSLWGKYGEGKSLTEKWFGGFRSIPPGMLLLALAGFVIMARLLGGIVSAATAGKGGGQADEADTKEARAAKRKADREKAAADAAAGGTGAETGGDAPKA
jgi:hypothetical protein